MHWKLLLALLLTGQWAVGQQHHIYDISDSTKPILLEEVIILHQPDVFEDSTLEFYQSSQLSNLDMMLHHMPDIKQISRGAFAREPVIHGMSAGQIKITIDGMHIYGACTDRMDPISAYVEPSNLKDIELGTGSAGMAFGPTIGGSINLHTADPRFSKTPNTKAMLSADYHSISNGQDLALQLLTSGKRLASEVTATYRDHQPYRAGGGDEVAYSQYHKLNLSWIGKWQVNTHHLLKADIIYDDAWDIGYPGLPMDVASAKARIFGLDHTHFVAGGKLDRIHSKVFFNTIAHAMDDSNREVPIHMDMPGISRTMGAFSEAFWHFGHGHELMAKVDVHRHLAKADMTMYPDDEAPMYMLTWPDSRRLIAGTYLRYMYHHHRHGFQVDARFDYANATLTTQEGLNHWAVLGEDLSKADQRATYNLSATWGYEVSHRLRSHITLGYSERLPTLSEQFGFYLYNAQDGFDYLGNPHISNEKAGQATWNMIYTDHHGTASLKLVGYRIKDYIFGHIDTVLHRMTPGANGVKRQENVPYAYITGVSGSYHFHLNHHWSVIGNAEYLYSWLEDGSPVPQIPPFMGVAALRFTGNRWFVQGESDWALAQHRVNHEFGEHPSHGHSIWNLRAVYEWEMLHKVWEVELAIENLMDQEYHLFLDWGQVPRQGRNIKVGMEVHL